MMNSDIINVLNEKNYITTQNVIELGYTKTLLSKYVKEGKLERVRHGIHVLPNSIHDDMYTLMMRSEKISFFS